MVWAQGLGLMVSEVQACRRILARTNQEAMVESNRVSRSQSEFSGRISLKLGGIGYARACVPLLAWRTVHTHRLTLGPPRYIQGALQCAILKLRMSQRGFGAPHPVPSIVPPVSNLKTLDFRVEFHQQWEELGARARPLTPVKTAPGGT